MTCRNENPALLQSFFVSIETSLQYTNWLSNFVRLQPIKLLLKSCDPLPITCDPIGSCTAVKIIFKIKKISLEVHFASLDPLCLFPGAKFFYLLTLEFFIFHY